MDPALATSTVALAFFVVLVLLLGLTFRLSQAERDVAKLRWRVKKLEEDRYDLDGVSPPDDARVIQYSEMETK